MQIDHEESPPPLISLHALVGKATTETLRITRTTDNKDLVILIDESSTHNVVQDRVVKFLELQVYQSSNSR